MHEKRGRRGKEKTGVNKRYPSQFLSSCLGGTAARVSAHTHTRARTCTHRHAHTHTRTADSLFCRWLTQIVQCRERWREEGREPASRQARREKRPEEGKGVGWKGGRRNRGREDMKGESEGDWRGEKRRGRVMKTLEWKGREREGATYEERGREGGLSGVRRRETEGCWHRVNASSVNSNARCRFSHWPKQAQWQIRILLPGSSLSSY